jgi:hypothetical protein
MDFDGWYAISSRSVCVFPSFRPCNRTGNIERGRTLLSKAANKSEKEMNWNRMLMGVVGLAMAGCSIDYPRFEAREDFKTSVPVDGQLELDVTTFNGNISVRESAESSIDVVAHMKARGNTQEEADAGLAFLKPTVETNASGIKLIVKRNAERTNYSDSVAFELSVPSKMKLMLKTSNGAVECYDRKADLEIKISNGGIRLERFQGSVVANTSNGKIEVIESQGTMSLKSSNGKISLKSCALTGVNTLHTSNGGIQVELVPGSGIGLTAQTSNGTVSCNASNSKVEQSKKSRMEGVLFGQEDDAKNMLDLKTSNGNISISEASGKETTLPETAAIESAL